MSTGVLTLDQVPQTWTRSHLLDIESLTREEVELILDTAEAFKDKTDGCKEKTDHLKGKTTANLFFENSTRTRTSFSLAARRLGADSDRRPSASGRGHHRRLFRWRRRDPG